MSVATVVFISDDRFHRKIELEGCEVVDHAADEHGTVTQILFFHEGAYHVGFVNAVQVQTADGEWTFASMLGFDNMSDIVASGLPVTFRVGALISSMGTADLAQWFHDAFVA